MLGQTTSSYSLPVKIKNKTLLLHKTATGTFTIPQSVEDFSEIGVMLGNYAHANYFRYDVCDIVYATNGYQFHPSFTQSGYVTHSIFGFVDATTVKILQLNGTSSWTNPYLKIYGY